MKFLKTSKIKSLIGRQIKWSAPSHTQYNRIGGISVIVSFDLKQKHPLVCETIMGDNLSHCVLDSSAHRGNDLDFQFGDTECYVMFSQLPNQFILFGMTAVEYWTRYRLQKDELTPLEKVKYITTTLAHEVRVFPDKVNPILFAIELTEMTDNQALDFSIKYDPNSAYRSFCQISETDFNLFNETRPLV